MKKVCFIQPLVANYCVPLFDELGKHCQLTVVYSSVEQGKGYGEACVDSLTHVRWLEIPTLKPCGDKVGMYQANIIKHIRDEKPDAVIIFANVRYTSFWTTLLWCKLNNIAVYPHGHGLYRKQEVTTIWKFIYKVITKLSTQYICYTQSVAESLLNQGIPPHKIAVAENSQVNLFPVRSNDKELIECGILFIGRLREGCNLDLLIEVITKLRVNAHPELTLHIIGDGENLEKYRLLAKELDYVRFYGGVYDASIISEISKKCVLGCYPGNAGLSVVHMMSLSLPVITHSEMWQHQGPEPSYIKDGINGVLYDNSCASKSLYSALKHILDKDMDDLQAMQGAAFNTYNGLMSPTLAKRFIKILDA